MFVKRSSNVRQKYKNMVSIKFTIKKTPNRDGKYSITLVSIKKIDAHLNGCQTMNMMLEFESSMLKTNKKGLELKELLK
jgi:hypothetical protein